MPECFVAKASEMQDGDRRIVVVGNAEIGVFYKDGAYFAYSNHCLHSGGPACEGIMINRVVDVIARDRNYQDFLIVDVDAHHYESESYREVFEYIENPVIRRQALESAKRGGRASMLGGTIGYQDIGGRITRHELRRHDIQRHNKLA